MNFVILSLLNVLVSDILGGELYVDLIILSLLNILVSYILGKK